MINLLHTILMIFLMTFRVLLLQILPGTFRMFSDPDRLDPRLRRRWPRRRQTDGKAQPS